MTKGTVLVVDDDPDIVDLLTDTLELDGYQVQATVGSLILPLARATRPSVILLDIMMPGKDGVTVGQRLRDDPRTAAIPLIAVSASTRLHVQAAEMGAVACVAKPFDIDTVRECVAQWAAPPDPDGAPAGAGRPGHGSPEERNKRPGPRDVHGWFAGDIGADTLVDAVTTLRADPNWGLLYVPGPPTWTLTLTYWPTGEDVHIALERAGSVWRSTSATRMPDYTCMHAEGAGVTYAATLEKGA